MEGDESQEYVVNWSTQERIPVRKEVLTEDPESNVESNQSEEIEKLKEYKVVRNEFMAEHKYCMAKWEGCTGLATECHHSRGRIADLLTDKRYFKALCHNCHCRVETEPLLAKELGLSANRFVKEV